jgi:hypothetical protein
MLDSSAEFRVTADSKIREREFGIVAEDFAANF